MTRFFTYVLAATLLGAILTNCATHARLQAERLAHAQDIAAAEKSRADEEAKRRKAEQELSHATEQHALDVAAAASALSSARAAGRAESQRLRDAATAAAERARAQCADPASAGLGTPAGDPIGVLADVLGRADERASLLADIADQRYIAGRACEREYDAARKALTEN